MKKITLMLVSAGLMAFLSSCGGSDNSSAASGATAEAEIVEKSEAVTTSQKLFEKEITKRACDFLTLDDVATLFGVDQAIIQQRLLAGMCLYSWEGGQASLGHLRTSKDLNRARDAFENSYKTQTGEELADQMAQVKEQMKKNQDGGKTDIDPEHTAVVTDALSNAFSGGFQYEDIPGLGDAARFDVTRIETEFGGKTFVSYANTLNVLTGNLKFAVSFSREGESQLYRDENIALAKVVLGNLEN